MEIISFLAKLVVALAVLIWWVLKGLFQGLGILLEYLREYTPVVLGWVKKTLIWIYWKIHFIARENAPKAAQFLNLVKNYLQAIKLFLVAKSRSFSQSVPIATPGLNTQFKAKLISRLSIVGMTVTFVALFFLIFPDFALKILPYQTEPIVSAVDQSVLGGDFSDGNLYSSAELPEKNEYLPTGNWLVISKIGVMTEIRESSEEDHEEVLKKGVWRVPDFASPVQKVDYPTILVAHKYGYLVWSNQYRRQNSFYNLDKLEIGDTFEVIWDQRRFVYEIYAGDEGKDITDYKADVILYTCKHLNSPIRIFRYARRVEY